MVAFGTILARITTAAVLGTVIQAPLGVHTEMAAGASARPTELTASDGQIYDHFGTSMAISQDGRTLLIGAAYHNRRIGAAYVFARDGGAWRQQAELTAPDGKVDDQFGYTVALSQDGTTALIGGAMQRNGSTGAAYVFTRRGSAWHRQAVLKAPDGAGNDEFGHAVALSADGSTALIGAVGRRIFTGAAYLFVNNGSSWRFQQELTVSKGKEGDNYGAAVVLSQDGSSALIGAPGQNYETGALYVYARQGDAWAMQTVLTAQDHLIGDTFGDSVALSLDGNTLMAGAPDRHTGTGAVYVYSRSGAAWTRQAELTAPERTKNALFGISIALSQNGSTALVGAQSYQPSGAAYVFGRSGTSWSVQAALRTSGQLTGASFGASAALTQDGSAALVGADGPFSTGSVFLFARHGSAWR